jgi:nitrite reductase/ring-hydroxylating ferredoxin subunit
MDMPTRELVRAGSLEELKAKGRVVLHGDHRPILVIYDRGRIFAIDNRCPHMGFPLERGSVDDGILTCHWHHARFDLESGCTFDLWADDVPTFPVEVRKGEVWVKTTVGHADPAAHWRQRLADGLDHDLGLVIAKAVHGQLAADVPQADVVRQVVLFGARNRDGWGVGMTILTALANLLPMLPEEEAYLALFHGARRVAADMRECGDQCLRREWPSLKWRATSLAARSTCRCRSKASSKGARIVSAPVGKSSSFSPRATRRCRLPCLPNAGGGGPAVHCMGRHRRGPTYTNWCHAVSCRPFTDGTRGAADGRHCSAPDARRRAASGGRCIRMTRTDRHL